MAILLYLCQGDKLPACICTLAPGSTAIHQPRRHSQSPGPVHASHTPNETRNTQHAVRITDYELRITNHVLLYTRSPTPIGIITNPLITLG